MDESERSQRKIMLIEPPFYSLFKDTYSLVRYPLSLGYLAGAIRGKTDWDVCVYNADFRPRWEAMKVDFARHGGFENYLDNLQDLSRPVWRDIKATIEVCAPAVVGISAKSQNFKAALAVAKLVKEADSRTIVVMGGPHPSMVGAEVMLNPEVDVCVVGEGERTVVELLDAINARRTFDGVSGIIHRKDSQVVRTPPRVFIEDLDSLPFPHLAAPEVLKDYGAYPVEAFANVFATRGCPHQCFFCGSREIWSRKVRFRSPDNVAKEIGCLQKLGLKRIHFDDDTFGVNRKNIHELCRALRQDCPGINWSCEIHVNLVEREIISAMKAAGCRWIQMGVESGDNSILSAIRKGYTIDQALQASRIIKREGVGLEVFFMVGFPQETEDSLKHTVAAMKKIDCDKIAYSIFTPYPGTEAFLFCKQHGLIGDDFDVSLYNHQSPANSFCMNIAPERFKMLAQDVGKMVIRRNWLKRLKNAPSIRNLKRIPELGISKSLAKGFRALVDK